MDVDILLNLAAIPAVFGALLYVGGILLSHILNKPDIRKFAEAELINLLYVMLIIIMLPAMNILATQYTQFINKEAYNELCAPYPNILDNGRCHVVVAGVHVEMMGREIIEYYSNVFLVETFLSLVNGIGKMDVVEGGKSVSTSLFSPFTAPTQYFFTQIGDFMGWLAMIEFAQLNFLWIVTDPTFFQGILVLGILLRMFPPLKTMGGLLMAIAIALYYIYPMALVTVDAHYRKAYEYEAGKGRINRLDFIERMVELTGGWILTTDELEKGVNVMDDKIQTLQREWTSEPRNPKHIIEWFRYFSALVGDSIRVIVFVVKIALVYSYLFLGSIFRIVLLGLSPLSAIGGAYVSEGDLVPVMLNMVSEFMLVIAVTAYLTIISLVAFIKSFSPLIGGDVEIAGISKLL